MDYAKGSEIEGFEVCSVDIMVEPLRQRKSAMAERSELFEEEKEQHVVRQAEKHAARQKRIEWRAERARRAEATIVRIMQGSRRARESDGNDYDEEGKDRFSPLYAKRQK